MNPKNPNSKTTLKLSGKMKNKDQALNEVEKEEKKIANLQKEFPFTPHGNNIILEQFEEAEVRSSGIIIPEHARHPLTQGRVLKTGNAVSEDIKPGMSVIFALHTDNSITIDGKKYIVIQEENVYAYGNIEK